MKRDRKAFLVIWVGRFLATAGLAMVVPFLPFYLDELGATGIKENRLWTGLSLAAPAIMFIWAAPLWGRCGDRWGRKWMVVRGVFGIAISLALMSLARTPFQFFLCRLLQGLVGGDNPAAAFVGSQGREEERGRALGSLQSAVAAGSLIGPLIGGPAAYFTGFRPLLLALGFLTGVNGLLSALILREVRPPPKAQIKEGKGPSAPPRPGFFDLLGNRRLRTFLIAGIWIQVGVFGLVTIFAPHVERLTGSAGLAATWVGGLQAILWGAAMVGAPWWGRRNDQTEVEKNFFWSAVAGGLSIFLQAIPQNPAWLIPLRIVQGFCFGAILPSILLVVTQESSDQNRGMWIGAASSFLFIGQILGALFGALLGGGATEWIFILLGGAHIIGGGWVRFKLREPIGAPLYAGRRKGG
ncbi:MFS transporter [Candidatus Manganitrophus noduliformans]|uniref:Multidrug efflux MFS transporter n=1 Tax=Candidatus Manganitrophus noduliformans TaxID=2606439 RepID=A0A7X6IDK3_9BACT|nr:MFS transporter [Candidatus Manganitrophus noduliformans]NKE73555.1 multidrug efflux MFS transporter [Candidatus Manganitrophus noduliformans]